MSDALSYSNLKTCKSCINLSCDYVAASGNAHADIMIVVSNPTQRDHSDGRFLSGPSGEVFDMMLDQLGMPRESIYITGAVKCTPPGNREIHEEEYLNCIPTWLFKEIREVNPKVVVLVGKNTTRSVSLGKIPFKHCEPHKTKSRIYLPINHPGYYIRRGDIDTFVNTVSEKLKELYGRGTE